jgi:hypothetical protein
MSWNGSVRIGARQHAGEAEEQPDLRGVADELAGGRVRLEDAEQAGIDEQDERRECPDGQQHDLAPEIVADLDLLLVRVRRLVHLVVALRLEEEVAGLAGGHRHQPADQRRDGGVEEDQHVGAQEADRADEVQRLIDPAVVIVAMVVPALNFECVKEAAHRVPSRCQQTVA